MEHNYFYLFSNLITNKNYQTYKHSNLKYMKYLLNRIYWFII